MLKGQHIGPFLVERELGAGAMGAVYLATYVKSGQKVAIKVMSANMGSSNPNSQKRFEREANILKQLKHPNIVRLFGIGKHQNMPYYAMEYIQGETLDRIIARRDRMTWEQVIDLGKQLCAALQHAHDAGIVHRDLKPSNLMILADGTLKLTDFGIAKDLDVTQLTGANCTVGTAAYMSPEQCRGENITSKSDLYSLGVVFYELLTGRKPFIAESAVEMFMLHIQGVPERPSRSLPELPKWMDTLIVQLLEKRPDQRPRDAAMVGDVLAEIQEKVESGASAGLDKANARRGDLPKGEELSEEDKEAARSLLGKKPKKKKKKDDGPKGPPVWLKAAGILAALVGVAALITFLAMPPSARVLYAKAEMLVGAGRLDDAMADGGPIRRYLSLYGGQDTPETAKMREWADDHVVREFEQIMAKHVKHEREKALMPVGARDDDEKNALAAALKEYDGDRADALRLWKLVSQDSARVGPVARRHLAYLEALDRQEAEWGGFHEKMREARGDIEDDELDALKRQAFAAWRQQKLGDLGGAKAKLEALRKEARESPGGQYLALYAAVQMKALKARMGETEQDSAARVAAVRKATEAAVAAIPSAPSLLTLRVTLHDVVSLYGKDEGMADVVKEAREGLKEIDKRLGPRG